MKLTRRQILAGLAATGATASCPALAQWNESDVIRSETDPFARVDPYGRSGGRDPMFERGRRNLDSFSEEDEINLGRRTYRRNIAESGGTHSDKGLQVALKAFASDFFSVAQRAHLPWEVTLLADPTPNAWAMPGGMTAFNAGLISFCQHPGEFAAIVAHEIGHVDYRHFADRMQVETAAEFAQKQGIDFALPTELVGDGLNPDEIESYFEICALAYRREHEFEADDHRMFIFERLGIDPKYLLAIDASFVRFSYVNGHHRLNEMVITHPSAIERLEATKGKVPFARWKVRDFPYRGWDVLKAAFPTPPEWKRA